MIQDLRLFMKAYPVAKSRVLAAHDTHYPGCVRTQLAYHETRTELTRRGLADDDITGAVIYIAVGVAYLLNR